MVWFAVGVVVGVVVGFVLSSWASAKRRGKF
jgi:hypothetical protein